MTKFAIGDRVKCVEGHEDDFAVRLRAGEVYTVQALDAGGYVAIDGESVPGWMPDRFELYAKAGEFVAGDVAFALHADGPLSAINEVRASEDGQRVEFSDDLGRWWPASGYRLATPEEIAAAEFAEEMAEVERQFPTTEIPAADFDFSTIKAGDVAVIWFEVLADGLTHEYASSDRFVKVYQPDFGPYYFRPSAFHSVIPRPKPKTLRERAIEAATTAWNDANYSDRTIERLALAVLAEVEKG